MVPREEAAQVQMDAIKWLLDTSEEVGALSWTWKILGLVASAVRWFYVFRFISR